MRKSLAAVTVAASLLGGGAVAVALGPASAIAQDDDGERAGRWVEDVFDQLVSEEVLTPEQAEAVAAALAEARPERPPRGPGRFHRGAKNIEAVAEIVGLTPAELGEALRSGQTLAEVADANGVDPQILVDALVAQATQRLDDAVAAGDIDASRAEDLAADIEQRVTDMVNGEARFRGGHGGHGAHGGHGRPGGHGPDRFGGRGWPPAPADGAEQPPA